MQGLLAPAGLMVLARLLNVGAGLVMIPVLIHFLQGGGFGAWAVLLATSIAFSTLEVGMPATLIKHNAGALDSGRRDDANVVRNHVLVILGVTFGISAPFVFALADALARLVGLPETDLLSSRGLIIFVFCASAARAWLQTGIYTLYAARRFRAVAAIFFLQPFLAHCVAIVVSATTRRLDLTLISFWSAQLLVVAAVFVYASLAFSQKFSVRRLDTRVFRQLFAHGFKVQINAWTQLINFQFDKFVIAAVVGLTWVAPYEVANRSVLALRGLPVTGIDTFLPAAALGGTSGPDAWERYIAMTRLGAYSAIAFMLAPLAVSPMFLYAWTGELGYLARWAFAVLLLGATANVLVLPAEAMLQAAGRAGILAWCALTSVAANIVLSLVLVYWFGLVGGATGTSIAMTIGAALLLAGLHRTLAWPLSATLKLLIQFWPCLAISIGLGLLIYAPFDAWVTSYPPGARYTKEMRFLSALLAAGLYVLCLGLMIAAQVHRAGLSAEECRFLTTRIRFKWFVSYCNRRARPERHLYDVQRPMTH